MVLKHSLTCAFVSLYLSHLCNWKSAGQRKELRKCSCRLDRTDERRENITESSKKQQLKTKEWVKDESRREKQSIILIVTLNDKFQNIEETNITNLRCGCSVSQCLVYLMTDQRVPQGDFATPGLQRSSCWFSSLTASALLGCRQSLLHCQFDPEIQGLG